MLRSEINGANEDSAAVVWKALMSKPETNQIKADDSKIFARRVYRLHVLPEASSPPYSRLESDAGPSTTPLEDFPMPQQSGQESRRSASTRIVMHTKESVCIWSCCWCRDYSGNYTTSGMTTKITSCPGCVHARCNECPVEWVKIRSHQHG